MGVPAFYRWISEKYAKIVVDVLEQRPMVVNGTVMPLNLNDPNPNSLEFDNLYIDMNGLIHPCSHPEDREAPKTEEEMYLNVTKYVDRLVAAIRPRKVLFLAIDGVAPRAKMNQQRSRRFRSAQEVQERKKVMEDVMEEMVSMGYDTPQTSDSQWDSNVITPGTEFMTKLSAFLRFYILDRMNKDPFWKNLRVVVSDASEPGEGEHKIMDFIRTQRTQPGYDPNTHHVLHGLDADLIMLALATHEARFTILREKVFFGRQQEKEQEVSDAQKLLNAQSQMNGNLISAIHPEDEWIFKKPLQALHIHTLREYLDFEFKVLRQTLPFPFDLERVIDDFIFMCFFVGNDFLPHLPSLDIRDGALDFLMECYKDILPSLGDYLTRQGGYINMQQADVLLSKVGEIEDQIFQLKNRAETEHENKMERRKQMNRERFGDRQAPAPAVPAALPPAPPLDTPKETISEKNNAVANALREKLLSQKRGLGTDAAVTKETESPVEEEPSSKKRKTEGSTEDDTWQAEEEEELEETISPLLEKAKPKKQLSAEEEAAAKEELKNRIKAKESSKFDEYKKKIVDSVKLHESGWKQRYYGEPFKKENIEKGGGLRKMCISYVQGLCWVLQYYYQGVPSWNWYYPFHYAPFASDLVNIDTYGKIDEFEKSSPFRPLEQLLAVLPANSAGALPEECRWLMLDTRSPIIDLYNDDVPIDPNGKHLPWLWILLLPFIDERRISVAFDQCKANLTFESRQRNRLGGSVLFVHESNSITQFALENHLQGPAPETDPELLEYYNSLDNDSAVDVAERSTVKTPEVPRVDLSCAVGGNLSGSLGKAPSKWFAALHARAPAPPGVHRWMSDIAMNRVCCFDYKLPVSPLHESKLLPGATAPPSMMHPSDFISKRPPRLNKTGFNIIELFYNNKGPSLQERTQGYMSYDDRHGHLHGGGYNGNNLMPQRHTQLHGRDNGYGQQQSQGQFSRDDRGPYRNDRGGRGGGRGDYRGDYRGDNRQGDYRQGDYQRNAPRGDFNRSATYPPQQYAQHQQSYSAQSHSSYYRQDQGPPQYSHHQQYQQHQQSSYSGGRGYQGPHRTEPLRQQSNYRPSLLTGSTMQSTQVSYSHRRPQHPPQQQSGGSHQPQQQATQRSSYSHASVVQTQSTTTTTPAMTSSMQSLRAQLLQTVHSQPAPNNVDPRSGNKY